MTSTTTPRVASCESNLTGKVRARVGQLPARFYWSINLGALVSYTLVSYVCQYGLPFLGGQEWGFMVGYSIPCIAMSLALVVFMAGTPK